MRLTKLCLQLALLALSEAIRFRRGAEGTARERRSCGSRDCTDEELHLVRRSRCIFQKLIAPGDLAEMRDAPQLGRVLQYLENALEIVNAEAKRHGEAIRVGLADAITEYMHKYMLPIAKYLYYAGVVQYTDIHKVNTFYDFVTNISSINTFVIESKTSFSNFSQLNLDTQSIIQPKPNPDEDNCKKLYTTLTADGETVIALPYFDIYSVALPLKEKPIRELRSQYSDNILVKFYIYSIDCLIERNSNYTFVRNFRKGLLDLLKSNVVPRLFDSELYPAFAGSVKLIHSLDYYQANQSDMYLFLTTQSSVQLNESNYSINVAGDSTTVLKPITSTTSLLKIEFILSGLIGIILALFFVFCRICVGKILKKMRQRCNGGHGMYNVVPGFFDSSESIVQFELPIARCSKDSLREVIIVEPNHNSVKTNEATTQTRLKKKFKCQTAELRPYCDKTYSENIGNGSVYPVHSTYEKMLSISETEPNATVDWCNAPEDTSKSNSYFESVMLSSQVRPENEKSSTSSGGSFELFSSKFHALFKKSCKGKNSEKNRVEF